MSELPPVNNPGRSEGPPAPEGYVGYMRTAELYGTPEKLKALADGYFGLNTIFIFNIALVLGSRALGGQIAEAAGVWGGLALEGGVIFLLIAATSFPSNQKIALGKGWQPGNAILASVLMGLNSALCCGIIGYLVMQSIAAKEMAKYGIKGSIFGGIKKPQIYAKIEQMKVAPAAPPPPMVPPAAG